MRKNKLGSILIYFFVLALVVIPASCQNVELQLGFILDGSSSIIPSDWNLMITGLANVVNSGTFPKDGSVELTVVQIGVNSGAQVEVGPEVVTASSAPGIASKISTLKQGKEDTPLACGFLCLADAMFLSANFRSDKKQIINIITDGAPTACCDVIGTYVENLCAGLCPPKTSTVNARNFAVSKLGMTMDKDLITCEFVGNSLPLRNWLRDEIVWPQQGTIAPPYIINHGWVRVISSFKELEEAINEKIKAIVSPIKSKKATSNQINQNINQNTLGINGIGGLRTGSLWLSQNGVNIANVNGSNNEISQNINQNALGTARLR